MFCIALLFFSTCFYFTSFAKAAIPCASCLQLGFFDRDGGEVPSITYGTDKASGCLKIDVKCPAKAGFSVCSRWYQDGALLGSRCDAGEVSWSDWCGDDQQWQDPPYNQVDCKYESESSQSTSNQCVSCPDLGFYSGNGGEPSMVDYSIDQATGCRKVDVKCPARDGSSVCSSWFQDGAKLGDRCDTNEVSWSDFCDDNQQWQDPPYNQVDCKYSENAPTQKLCSSCPDLGFYDGNGGEPSGIEYSDDNGCRKVDVRCPARDGLTVCSGWFQDGSQVGYKCDTSDITWSETCRDNQQWGDPTYNQLDCKYESTTKPCSLCSDLGFYGGNDGESAQTNYGVDEVSGCRTVEVKCAPRDGFSVCSGWFQDGVQLGYRCEDTAEVSWSATCMDSQQWGDAPYNQVDCKYVEKS